MQSTVSAEMVNGALQLVIYFVTLIGTVLGYLLTTRN
jgi:hypothetical protein